MPLTGKGVIDLDRIKEIVEKLPEWLQPFAERYARIIADKGFEELQLIADSVVEGNWETAYRHIIAGMATEDLTAELSRINAGLKGLNKQNVEKRDVRKEIVRQALITILAMFRAEIGA